MPNALIPADSLLMSVDEAKQLTLQILNNLEDTWKLILEAWNLQAWKVLGYKNWATYTKEEFSSDCIKLPTPKRLEAVTQMTEAGMSTREIGAAIGVTHATVQQDLKEGGRNLPPDEIADAEVVEDAVAEAAPAPVAEVAAPPIPPLTKDQEGIFRSMLKTLTQLEKDYRDNLTILVHASPKQQTEWRRRVKNIQLPEISHFA